MRILSIGRRRTPEPQVRLLNNYLPMRQGQIEQQVMERLLAGDHPVLRQLRVQYAAASVTHREFSGVGFFTHYSVPERVGRVEPPRFQLTDLTLEIQGSQYGAGVILFIHDGALDMLEAYMWAEDWPEEPEITAVRYLHETPDADSRHCALTPADVRDPSTLVRALGA